MRSEPVLAGHAVELGSRDERHWITPASNFVYLKLRVVEGRPKLQVSGHLYRVLQNSAPHNLAPAAFSVGNFGYAAIAGESQLLHLDVRKVSYIHVCVSSYRKPATAPIRLDAQFVVVHAIPDHRKRGSGRRGIGSRRLGTAARGQVQ